MRRSDASPPSPRTRGESVSLRAGEGPPVSLRAGEGSGWGEGRAAQPFVIYYGWLTDDAQGEPNAVARAIAAAGTPLLIAHLRTAAPAGHRNLSSQVLALMRAAGVQ